MSDVSSRRPIVDVLIPAYNAADTIADAIATIQRQTLSDLRIVVVDDGSTDGTAEVLARLKAEDPRIHVVSRANGGIVEALNDGLKLCTAEFVARHDADDYAYPDRLARQIEHLRRHPRCVAVDASFHYVDGERRRFSTFRHAGEEIGTDPDRIPANDPYLMHFLITMRRSAVEAIGGYRHVVHAEDVDLCWRLSSVGEVRHVTEILGDYTVHDRSIMSASVLNARISAVESERAAMSVRRRRDGLADLLFERGIKGRYQQAASLEGILDVAGAGLAAGEKTHLVTAACAKFLKLAVLRSYRLQVEDAVFVRRNLLRNAGALVKSDRSQTRWNAAHLASRALEQGDLAVARNLWPGASTMASLYLARIARRLRAVRLPRGGKAAPAIAADGK